MQANTLIKWFNTRLYIIPVIVLTVLSFSQIGQSLEAADTTPAVDATAMEVDTTQSDFDVTVDIPAPEQNNGRCTSDPIRTTWFYKPPKNTSMSTVMKHFDIYVLTRDDEKFLAEVTNAGEGPVLQYIKYDAISDACFQAKKAKNTPCSCNIKPRANQVAWQQIDICTIRDEHPDWFLRDKSGNLMYWNEFVMMDPGNQGWREFWLSRIKQYQQQYPKWGGIFIDNMTTRFGLHSDTFIELQKYPTEKSYQDAVVSYLDWMQNEYFKPTNRLVYGNVSVRWGHTEPFLRYMEELDGAMDEFWAYPRTGYYSAKSWLPRVERAQKALERGKSMMLVSQGTQTDLNRQLFGLASYLLVAGDQIYFRYTSDKAYSQMWLYDNYKARLGTPLGYYTRSGNTFTRKFSNGTVTVNPETRKATITVKSATGGC
jgi:hypothetical protein